MTNYYIKENEQIVLHDTDKVRLINTLDFMPQYQGFEILETENLIIDGVMMTEEEYQAEQVKQERERINMLSLTAADVERAIYKAKGLDFDDIVATVTQLQPEGLDIKALKIELKANNFYRGNPYIDAVGTILGFTSEQLDKFFETKDYTALLPIEEMQPADDTIISSDEEGENPPVSEDEVTEG